MGKSEAVKDVALEAKVESFQSDMKDQAKIDQMVAGLRMEIQRVQKDIARLRRRIHAIAAVPWPLLKDWEIRIEEETFEKTGRIYFVNHKTKKTTFECPPPLGQGRPPTQELTF